MCNEIWSSVACLGAPSWFITFAPADVNHPIALYYADKDLSVYPKLFDQNNWFKLIAQNPVAGAHFFKYIVQLFIKHVLGVGVSHPGVYGNTAGWYGTVEQQGRLTLHLHMMLWIKNAPIPQEICDKILDPNSDFQKLIVEYLEGVHMGEFLNGPMEHIHLRVESKENESDSPTLTLPEHAPTQCKIHSNDDNCSNALETKNGGQSTKILFDHIVFSIKSSSMPHRMWTDTLKWIRW